MTDASAVSGNALRYAPFRWYLAANFLSLIGSWMERIALGWLAWELTHSPFWTGFVTVSALAPSGLLGPVIAVYAERWDVRRAVTAVNLALAALATVTFLYVVSGSASIGPVAVLALLSGALNACYHPVRLTMVANVVPRDQMQSAIGLNAVAFNISRILGPTLAGLLIATAGFGPTFLANAVSFLPLVMVIRLIPLQPADEIERSRRRGPLLEEMAAGLRYASSEPLILWALGVAAFNGVVIRAVIENFPAIVGEIYGGTSTDLTVLTAASGVGSICAGVLVGSIGGGEGKMRPLIRRVMPVAAVMVAVIGLTPAWPLVIAVTVVAGFTATIMGIGSQSVVQLQVRQGYRARVLTWWSTLSFGGLTLGGLALGAVGEVVPMGWAVTTLGAFGAVLALWLGRAPRA